MGSNSTMSYHVYVKTAVLRSGSFCLIINIIKLHRDHQLFILSGQFKTVVVCFFSNIPKSLVPVTSMMLDQCCLHASKVIRPMMSMVKEYTKLIYKMKWHFYDCNTGLKIACRHCENDANGKSISSLVVMDRFPRLVEENCRGWLCEEGGLCRQSITLIWFCFHSPFGRV